MTDPLYRPEFDQAELAEVEDILNDPEPGEDPFTAIEELVSPVELVALRKLFPEHVVAMYPATFDSQERIGLPSDFKTIAGFLARLYGTEQ